MIQKITCITDAEIRQVARISKAGSNLILVVKEEELLLTKEHFLTSSTLPDARLVNDIPVEQQSGIFIILATEQNAGQFKGSPRFEYHMSAEAYIRLAKERGFDSRALAYLSERRSKLSDPENFQKWQAVSDLLLEMNVLFPAVRILLSGILGTAETDCFLKFFFNNELIPSDVFFSNSFDDQFGQLEKYSPLQLSYFNDLLVRFLRKNNCYILNPKMQNFSAYVKWINNYQDSSVIMDLVIKLCRSENRDAMAKAVSLCPEIKELCQQYR